MTPNTIDNYVDRIFIININERIDKYQKMIKQFEKYNIHNFERFNACVVTYEDIHNDKNKSIFASKIYFKNAIGCKYSHLQVIQEAKKRNYTKILILEDDALLNPNFIQLFNSIIPKLDTLNWDMFYLGADHWEKGTPTDFINIKKVQNAYTTSSYILHQKIYDEILQNAPKIPIEIDTFYVKYIQNKYNVYAIYPNLITQYSSLSDISGNFTNYTFKEC